MKCPSCGSADVIHETRGFPYTYKGRETVFPAIEGDYCDACGEAVFDAATSERLSAEMLAFNRKVNASIVDPAEIATIRKNLGLDQKQAAEIFGGGVNAFSRYETGKTHPPVALVKLLRVIGKHPELLSEIR